MGVTLSGLGGGLDWRSIVDQLAALDRIQISNLEDDQAVNETKISTLEGVRSRMEDVESALEDLNDDDAFYGRNVSFGDPDTTVLSAIVDPNTLTGDYDFNITQLATQTTREGTSDISNTIASSSDVSGVTVGTMSTTVQVTDGTFTVNGAEVTFESTDSLQDVFDAINTATGGDVTASYNAGSDTISLTSASNTEIVLGSPTDSSNFLTATKLFSNGADTVSSNGALGALRFSDTLADANLVTPISGSGAISINGVEISYESTDTINSVVQRINDSSAGVTARYDAENDRITLNNDATGSLGLNVVDVSGNLGAALGITTGASLNLGLNAQYTLNGSSTITSTSNNLSEDSHGIAGLTVTAEELGTETVTVGVENSRAKDDINKFISEYNDLIDYLERNTEISVGDDGDIETGILSDNREMSSVISELRRALITSTSGENIKRLQDMGIDFESGLNTLEVEDEIALDDALEEFAGEIAEVFNDPENGIFASVQAVLDGYIEDDSTIDTATDSLRDQNDDIDNQIDQLDRMFAQREQTMIDGFLAMEQAQQEFDRQLEAISQIR